MKRWWNNPYLELFVSLALICCLAVSAIFMYINITNLKEIRGYFHQQQTDSLAEDMETQFSIMDRIGLKITINPKYQPFYLSSAYNDRVLLEDFKQYTTHSVLVNECILYYNEDENIYRSTGHVTDVEVYLSNFAEKDKQKMREFLSGQGQGNVLSTDQSLYYFVPIELDVTNDGIEAVLGCQIDYAQLSDRFQTVGGGMPGNISLYKEELLLFCNQEEPCERNEKNVRVSSFLDGAYTVCYSPEQTSFFSGNPSVLQVLLVLLCVALLVVISSFYAKHSYQPLLDMARKYGGNITPAEENKGINAVEELDILMNYMAQSNIAISQQINQKQEMLRRQFLQMLIRGAHTINLSPAYLEKIQMNLQGPYYYVVSVEIAPEKEAESDIWSRLTSALEKSFPDVGVYTYPICNKGEKQCSVVCSIREEEYEQDLNEWICGTVQEICPKYTLGLGNVYKDLSKVSASWLESIDNIHNTRKQADGTLSNEEMSVEISVWQRFFALLTQGNESGAVAEFRYRIEPFKRQALSFLMQQYFLSVFLGEFTRLAKENSVQLDNKELSLAMTVNNMETFEEVILELVHDFCKKKNQLDQERAAQKSYQIFTYVNTHFAEYDISIEKIADDLNASAEEVRQAIIEHAGCKYKEYLVFLRIEYAKHLLLKGDMSVSDICQKVGYGNVSYFVTLFKKVTGMSPTSYKSGASKREDPCEN